MKPATADHRDLLLSIGLIRPADPSSFAECPHCGLGTIARVNPRLNGHSGQTSLWLPCGECGLVEVAAESLRRWTLDVVAFAAAVAQAAGTQGQPEPFADGRGWFLGRATWAKRSHEVFLLRAVHAEKVPQLRDRLGTHPKAVVFTATAEDASAWVPHAGDQRVVALDAILSFEGELRCDIAVLEAMLLPEPVAVRVPNPRTARRAGLLAKIDRLKSELVEHIRTAKRYAYDMEERTGEAALLPRPTKSHLAKLAGLQPHDVTRCFRDSSGRELRILWEMADDLSQVMRYGG
jgi:hypothetical protein